MNDDSTISDAQRMWEADPVGDATAAICQIYSRQAAAIVTDGDDGAAVADLCRHMEACKVSQMSAAILCHMVAAVMQNSDTVPNETFVAAVGHAGLAMSLALTRHGAEGVGMAAFLVSAACEVACRRGEVLPSLRTIMPHLPQRGLVPGAAGTLRKVLVDVIDRVPGSAAEIVDGTHPASPEAVQCSRCSALHVRLLVRMCSGTTIAYLGVCKPKVSFGVAVHMHVTLC